MRLAKNPEGFGRGQGPWRKKETREREGRLIEWGEHYGGEPATSYHGKMRTGISNLPTANSTSKIKIK